MENAGEKIYNLRKKRGLSQDQLAKKIGVSRKTVYKWESDLALPTSENVESLCAALGVDVEYFYGSAPVKEESPDQTAAETRKPDPKREKSKRKKWITAFVISGVAVSCMVIALVIHIYHLLTNEPFDEEKRVVTTTSVIEVNWVQTFLFIGIMIFAGVILYFAIKFIVKKYKSNKKPND